MEKFRVLVFCDDIFALRLAQFEVFTYFMNDNSTFFTLKDIRKPSVGEFMTKIAKIERFEF